MQTLAERSSASASANYTAAKEAERAARLEMERNRARQHYLERKVASQVSRDLTPPGSEPQMV